MGSGWSYVVTHYDKSNSWASQDLTAQVESLPLFTDIAGTEINQAIVEISTRLGHYIRAQRSGESGFPTIIDHNDRIRIVVSDGVTVGGYDQVFEVKTKLPIKTKAGGTKMRLQTEGLERHLMKVKYIKPHRFVDPNSALVDLVQYYNDNKTTDMPTLTIGTNELPTQGTFNFDWGVNEETILNRIIELVDMMGDAGGTGGVLDFFDFRFTYSGANVTSFIINVFSSGSPSSGSEVTIDADAVNTGDEAAGQDEAEGTQVGAWGDPEAGSLPIDYSRFASRQILMPANDVSHFPEWQAGTYPSGAIVKLAGVTYRSNAETITIPPSAAWDVLTTATYYGDVISYSPWTNDKLGLWKNSGADPTNASAFGAAMCDGNIIIRDDETFRTWVDLETTGTPSVFWAYGGTTSGYYDGMRVLVNGVGTGVFSGTDSNGKAYDYSVAEWSNVDQDWKVKYDAFGDATLDSMQVVVFDNAKVYVWNNPSVGSWNRIDNLDNGSDCFHNYDSISQTTSVHIDADTELEYVSNNNGSGIKAIYSWTPATEWAQNTFNIRTSAEYYRSGAWLTIRFPFPKNTYNSITEDVGEIYGGGVQGTTVKEPSAIDAQNMHFTHDGYRGFNTASADTLASLDYGPLSSIDFFMKLIFSDTAGTVLPDANFKMRCWMWDKEDNVVFQDFVLQHNSNYESVKLPLSGFQIYRGRRPRYDVAIIALNDLIPPNGLNANETFKFESIVGMSWGTLDSYDDFGRYQGGIKKFGISDHFLFTGRKIELWIDGLRFTKPLLYVTDAVSGTTLVKHEDFEQNPEVFIFDQLEQIAKSNLQKQQFKKTEYELENEIRTDIHYGDFFFFTDDEIVSESDTADNTVKLVNKGTEYSITKGVDGRGGGLRKIRGSRRFV